MKQLLWNVVAVAVLLCENVRAAEVSSVSGPEQEALAAERRRAQEAKFAAWRRGAPVLAQKLPSHQLRPHHSHKHLARQPHVEESRLKDGKPSAEEAQWQKDYEAFLELQKQQGSSYYAASLLTRLKGGLEAKVAEVRQQEEQSKQDRLREAKKAQLRRAQEEEANRHLAQLQAVKREEDAEVSLLRLQGEASQSSQLRERAREILAERGEHQHSSGEQQRFKQWQTAHETVQSQQHLFSSQSEAVKRISKEVEKHRAMFDVIQELQKEQRDHVKQLRTESDSTRFDRWQQSPQGSAVLAQMHEKHEKERQQERSREELVAEVHEEGNRFDKWKLQHQGRHPMNSNVVA